MKKRKDIITILTLFIIILLLITNLVLIIGKDTITSIVGFLIQLISK